MIQGAVQLVTTLHVGTERKTPAIKLSFSHGGVLLCISVSDNQSSVSLFSVQMLVSSPAVMNYLNAEKKTNCHPFNITCT